MAKPTKEPAPSAAQVFRENYRKACEKALSEFNAKEFSAEVVKDLNTQKREVILTLLGLEERFGNWEVDHCNGRNSPITKYLAETAEAEVKAWLDGALKDVLQQEREKAAARFKKILTDDLRNNLRNFSYEYAHKEAKRLASEIASEVKDEVVKEVKYE